MGQDLDVPHMSVVELDCFKALPIAPIFFLTPLCLSSETGEEKRTGIANPPHPAVYPPPPLAGGEARALVRQACMGNKLAALRREQSLVWASWSGQSSWKR